MQNIINRVVGPVHSGVEGFRSSYGSRGRRHEPLTKSEQEASRDTDHRQGNFETKDGSLLHYHAWFPKYTQDGHLTSKEPATLDSVRTVSAVVIFVHGLHEHAGRFAPWARIMTKFNIGVYGIDHRGHGRSAGMHGYISDLQEPVDDLMSFTESVQWRHPNVPIFYLGHSLGGYLSLEAARKFSNNAKTSGNDKASDNGFEMSTVKNITEEEIEKLYKKYAAVHRVLESNSGVNEHDASLKTLIPAEIRENTDVSDHNGLPEYLPPFLKKIKRKYLAEKGGSEKKDTIMSELPASGTYDPEEASCSGDSEGEFEQMTFRGIEGESTQTTVAGVIVHSPLISVSEQSTPHWFVEAVGKALNLTPLSRAPFVEGSGGKSYHDSVAEERLEEEIQDPLVYSGKLRIGTGLAIREAVTLVERNLEQYGFPILIQHGTADRVCHVSGSRKLVTRSQSSDKYLIEYVDAHHDLLRERESISTDVLDHSIAWIKEHMGASDSS